MGFLVEVWGQNACFTRPEMKVERVSYDVITPSAARGLLEAIYWHPGMKWVVDKIYVLNPIAFTNIRRNEVKAIAAGSKMRSVMTSKSKEELFIDTKDTIQQRASTILVDVRYIIEAHFEMTPAAAPCDNEGKFTDIIKRRLKKGQFWHCPYLGCREFPANFRMWEKGKIETAYEGTERDLGFMLYDMDFSDKANIQPQFFRAIMKNGVIDLTKCEVIR